MTRAADLADISPGVPTGFRNAIINGDFKVWQRGPSFPVTTAGLTYSADRWWSYNNGTGTMTASRLPFTVGNEIPGYESQYYHRFNVASLGTSTGWLTAHRIEDVRTFAGQTITVSFWAKTTMTNSFAIIIVQNFGTGGSSDVATTLNASQTILSNWTRYSFTITVPSIAGKTINANSFLQFQILAPILTTGNLDIWGVQVEAGTVATPFEQRPIGTELALCQRYYQVIAVPNTSYPAMYVSGTNTFYGFSMSLGTKMRNAPTGSYNYLSGTQYWVIPGTVALSANSGTGITIGTTDSAFKLNQVRQAGNGTPTSGNTYLWEADFSVAFNAEL